MKRYEKETSLLIGQCVIRSSKQALGLVGLDMRLVLIMNLTLDLLL